MECVCFRNGESMEHQFAVVQVDCCTGRYSVVQYLECTGVEFVNGFNIPRLSLAKARATSSAAPPVDVCVVKHILVVLSQYFRERIVPYLSNVEDVYVITDACVTLEHALFWAFSDSRLVVKSVGEALSFLESDNEEHLLKAFDVYLCKVRIVRYGVWCIW